MIRPLLAVHLACAAAAWLAFWLAALSFKGGARHRRVGQWFARAVYATAATGGLLAAIGLAVPSVMPAFSGSPAATRHLMAFVLYLLIVIVVPVQHGLAVIRAGHVPLRVRSRLHGWLNAAAIFGAIALLPASIVWHTWAFVLAVPAGFAIGLRNLAYTGRQAVTMAEWQREHLTSLLIAGIVFHTALFVLMALRWPDQLPVGWLWGAWFVPAAVGLLAIAWFRRTWVARPGAA